MKKYFWLFIFILISFYITEKVGLYVKNKHPIMEKIVIEKDNYLIASNNAIINENTIIPGISGKAVNVDASFLNMKKLGYYDPMYLIFDYTLPDISISNNKDKIIVRGNSCKRKVVFIIKDNETIKSYFINYKIKGSILITINLFDKSSFLEQINNDPNKELNLDLLLEKYNLKTSICYDICSSNKIKVQPGIIIDSNNIFSIKNNVKAGDIYLINENTSLKDIKILLSEINYRDLEITYLSDLIEE